MPGDTTINHEAMIAQYSLQQVGYESITDYDDQRHDCELDTREAFRFPMMEVLEMSGYDPTVPLTGPMFADLYDAVTNGYDEFRTQEDSYRAARDALAGLVNKEIASQRSDILRGLLAQNYRLEPMLMAFEERGYPWENDNPKYNMIQAVVKSKTRLDGVLKTPAQVQAFGDFCRKYGREKGYKGETGERTGAHLTQFPGVVEYCRDILGVSGVTAKSVGWTVTAFGCKLVKNGKVVAKP